MTASLTPDTLGDWPAWVWWAIAAVALVHVLAWLAPRFATPDAAAAPESRPVPPRAHCAVQSCDDEPTVNVYASDEWWLFCAAHGTPYLTEELRA